MTYNAIANRKGTREKYDLQTLHRKVKIEQHEPH